MSTKLICSQAAIHRRVDRTWHPPSHFIVSESIFKNVKPSYRSWQNSADKSYILVLRILEVMLLHDLQKVDSERTLQKDMASCP